MSTNVLCVCMKVIEITDYRAQLYDYIKNRMMAIAPNVTVLVGELVGARLIAHAGACNKSLITVCYLNLLVGCLLCC